jgi:hypothetical protein
VQPLPNSYDDLVKRQQHSHALSFSSILILAINDVKATSDQEQHLVGSGAASIASRG